MNQPHKRTIVDDHRNMLQVSKKVSIFQEQNLKSWAFIFFDGVERVSVNWNFIKNNENKDFYAGEIAFDIKFKKGVDIDPIKAKVGMDSLIASTKFLFWNESNVTIKKSGKEWVVDKSSKK